MDIQENLAKLNALQAEDGIWKLDIIEQLQEQTQTMMEKRELKWQQRAKECWLIHGDKNSKYFHACASQRRQKNLIFSIKDGEGVLQDIPMGIEAAFVQHFSKILSSSGPRGIESCIQVLPERVTADMNGQLLGEVSKEEISQALSQISPMKSPGPDGFPAAFYQEHWNLVGEEVVMAVRHFFSTGLIDPDINFTHITLVPKKKNPSGVSDFRPISLCNVVYKILAKVLANRLKLVLPSIISCNQSAFIPGRLISDNIFAVYETLHTMHTRMYGRVGYMAAKLDMSKAYDRVEWLFLEKVMKKMGFASKWVQLIMTCVTSVSYSVNVNRVPVGHIKPSRGIRQGDPLSPYLSIICAEVLSVMLSHEDRSGRSKGVPTSFKGMRINHLFFADDSLLFCKAMEQEWNCLKTVLGVYEEVSGQRLNNNKASIFFSRNTSQATKDQIMAVVGVPVAQRFDTYLGLPALVGKSRTREFQNLTDRVRKKLSDWKTKFLSQAGKEALLAKQGWRLMQYPDSLAAKIIKAKYFPTGSFMSANLDNKPSFAWRSILVGRKLLEEGLYWRIGNGRSVRICEDRWISVPITYHHEDKLIWRATNLGEFLVRSAYHLEKERQDRTKGECSKGEGNRAIWKMLWNLKIPQSVKVFLWRACSKILPTKDNLKQRRVLADDTCIFCCSVRETTHHILWDCPSSQDVWCVSGSKLQKCTSGGDDFCKLVENMMEILTREDMELFAIIAKKIWKRRNDVVHGQPFSHPSVVVKQAIEQLQLYRMVNVKYEEELEPTLPNRQKWEAPPSGLYKSNWDVAVDQGEMRMGVGVIIRDERGQIIATLSQPTEYHHEPAAAEAVAALKAVEFCREVGVHETILEGDSLLVVNAIKNQNQCWLRYGQIITDIKWVLESLTQWSIRHIKREANSAAHGPAKCALRSSDTQVWLEEVPSCISEIVFLEQMALML
ncbi:uncharacterized protein LOC132172916 [Corylus avellana]|uniref:uncharacterized protein LOC132172916 n=1 Tax=Corylus avellana TaxID=13451 RepID=UPI00286B5A70|nr:uncharacterized protein LOC132172916 [Corylus avellana]